MTKLNRTQKISFATLLAKMRLYIIRSMSYAGAIQFCLVVFLVTDKLHEKGYIGEMTLRYSIPLYMITCALIILFGYIEDKMGVLKAEQTILGERNEVLTSIHDKLQKIQKEQKRLKNVYNATLTSNKEK